MHRANAPESGGKEAAIDGNSAKLLDLAWLPDAIQSRQNASGMFGALMACRLFRHISHTQPFSYLLRHLMAFVFGLGTFLHNLTADLTIVRCSLRESAKKSECRVK